MDENNENKLNQDIETKTESINNIEENSDVEIKNIEENNEELEKGGKGNWYWIIYVAIVIVIFIIILLLLRGCNGLKKTDKDKINNANEWVTNMWNKCVDPIYWYTVDGTGVNGANINIDSVLADCDNYYKEYQEKKNEIISLDEKYSDFKETFNKISEQIEIIYPKIKANKPTAEVEVDYESNMDMLHEYQLELYNLIVAKYY